MYQVTVNETLKFELKVDNNELAVNGSPVHIDRVPINKSSSHFLYQNKSYNVELVHVDAKEKTATVKINGNRYMVAIKDQFDQLLSQLGMDNLVANKVLQVKAPMPGLVLSVLVEEGAEIKKGDNLLILEAMKMENMIKSPSDGIVRKVEIIKGDKVDKNQLLISFK